MSPLVYSHFFFGRDCAIACVSCEILCAKETALHKLRLDFVVTIFSISLGLRDTMTALPRRIYSLQSNLYSPSVLSQNYKTK